MLDHPKRMPDLGPIGAYPPTLVSRRGATLPASLKAKTAKIEAHLLNEVRTFEYVANQWLLLSLPNR